MAHKGQQSEMPITRWSLHTINTNFPHQPLEKSEEFPPARQMKSKEAPRPPQQCPTSKTNLLWGINPHASYPKVWSPNRQQLGQETKTTGYRFILKVNWPTSGEGCQVFITTRAGDTHTHTLLRGLRAHLRAFCQAKCYKQ